MPSDGRHIALDDLPEVCTVRQVAQFLRIAENSVYAAIRRDELPAVRLGRRLLVSRVALSRWLVGGSKGVADVAP